MPTELPSSEHSLRPAGSMRLDPRAEGLPLEETGELIAARKVEGTPVFDRAGERLGEIAGVMIEKRTGLVAYAVLGSGGFLGVGETHRPLPWRALAYDVEAGGYVIDDGAIADADAAYPGADTGGERRSRRGSRCHNLTLRTLQTRLAKCELKQVFVLLDSSRPRRRRTGFLRRRQRLLDRRDLAGHGAADLALRVPVEGDDPVAEVGQRGAAPVAPAPARLDEGLREHPVELVGQEPGTPVRHAELPPRRRDRPMPPDRLEQRHLARAEPVVGVEVEPKRDACRHGGASSNGSISCVQTGAATTRRHAPVRPLTAPAS